MSAHFKSTRDELNEILKHYCPLLSDLMVKEEGDFKSIYLYDIRYFLQEGCGDSIIEIKCKKFPDSQPDTKGILIYKYDSKSEIFLFNIIINSDLTKDPKALKMAIVHEFCHCVAYLMTRIAGKFSKIRFIEFLKKGFKDEILNMEELYKMKAFFLLSDGKQKDRMESDLDEHFRTGYEYLSISYTALYRHFLLPTKRIEEIYKEYRACHHNIELQRLIKEIQERECVDHSIVLARVCDEIHLFYTIINQENNSDINL